MLERAGQQLTLDLRLQVYRKLQGQSASYFESQRTGDLIARVIGDVDAIQDVLVRGTDAGRLDWLDQKLWAGGDDAFLPHGLAGGPHDALQPILLTSGPETPNGAH